MAKCTIIDQYVFLFYLGDSRHRGVLIILYFYVNRRRSFLANNIIIYMHKDVLSSFEDDTYILCFKDVVVYSDRF